MTSAAARLAVKEARAGQPWVGRVFGAPEARRTREWRVKSRELETAIAGNGGPSEYLRPGQPDRANYATAN